MEPCETARPENEVSGVELVVRSESNDGPPKPVAAGTGGRPASSDGTSELELVPNGIRPPPELFKLEPLSIDDDGCGADESKTDPAYVGCCGSDKLVRGTDD